MVRRVLRTAARVIIGFLIAVLVLVGLGIGLLETAWAKEKIRALIVHQANQYLTATLTIGRLEGSILRGISLGDVRLSRDAHDLVAIDEISVSYSVRELLQAGTVIRHIRLVRPRFVLAREADGRWDIATVVRRERREGGQTGPGRPIEIEAVEIEEGRVQLHDPLDLGAVHLPTDFDRLNAAFAFAYYPVRWRLDFESVSWVGREPDLSMSRLSGSLGNGPKGWFFDKLSVTTPRSAFTVNGGVVHGDQPTELDLTVHAGRFAFQEWSGVLHALKNIAVEGAFDATLKGPLSRLATVIALSGTGGSVKGRLTLDSEVPGWRGAGTVDLGHLNLAHWLNEAERPSDITGRVTFDLALEFGRGFPRGVYTFDGPHAMYMHYAGDGVKARGQITADAVLVAQASATAYGAAVELRDASIGVSAPFPFRFQGTVTRVDLRDLPATVPVPHVESLLTFDYDTTGQFSNPFITGRAAFAPSMFLGAAIDAGTVGTIDTSREPLRFSGDGGVEGADLRRFGEGLDVAWLQDPRYAGTITGRFHVDGHPPLGTDRATLALTGGGHLAHADVFHGALENADVSMTIDHGALRVSYAGGFSHIDPSVPFADQRWRASLTGSGTVSATVTDLLTRDLTLDDYDVDGSLALQASTIHGVAIDRGRLAATLAKGRLSIAVLEAAGPTIQGHGTGTIALDSRQESAFDYIVDHADLARLEAITGRQAAGVVSTTGRLTGPWSSLRLIGDGSFAGLDAFGVEAGGLEGHYDVTLPSGEGASARVAANARGTMLSVLGASIQEVSGTVDLRAQQLQFDLHVVEAERREGTIAGAVGLRLNDRALEVAALTIGLGHASWRLVPAIPPVAVQWDDGGVSITPAVLADPNGDERVAIAGSWRRDGTGALRVTVTHLFLDTLQAAFDRPTHYGGVVDLDATIRGTRDRPVVGGTIAVTNGRVERVSFQRLAGQVEYADHLFRIDLRVDQSPAIWMTAVGTVPMALFERSLPAQAIDVAVTSSGINLGLVEGLTDAVTRVSGTLLIDLRVTGTSDEPVFIGAMSVDAAAFQVAASGVAYKNGKIGLTLTADRVGVEVFHLEDSNGRQLEVRGSLGTRQLRVGDLEINVSARRFAVMRNEFGRLDVDADLRVQGRFDAPRLTGDLTISSGELRVDEILQRTLLQPRSTEETAIVPDQTAPALGVWQLLGLDVRLRVPNTLRLMGDNVQVSPGTPMGLGNINLRVAGDLSLYKDPRDRMYLTGSFDTINGTYAFQGRRFDVDPTSSIVFRGDLDPELYVAVRRTISGVETRVSLIGPMRQPELRLSSVPPLDQSDILSLIVFNTSVNDLNTLQQQQLAVRAGVLAAGFLATPIVSAISNEIGLDILEIQPGSDLAGDFGAKLTVGQEIAPGLVARFSRQFGSEPYDEATVEYFLSRIIRLRATFSDAQSLNARSPFRRIERAGIDLLFFFSF